MCLAQGPQRSDAGEARTHGSSVSSQSLYNRATVIDCAPMICRGHLQRQQLGHACFCLKAKSHLTYTAIYMHMLCLNGMNSSFIRKILRIFDMIVGLQLSISNDIILTKLNHFR